MEKMSEKTEFIRFFQKYGIPFRPYDDPKGIIVGQSVFLFEDERFYGVHWEELCYTEKRIKRIDPKITDRSKEKKKGDNNDKDE